jgi:hypothetical protein
MLLLFKEVLSQLEAQMNPHLQLVLHSWIAVVRCQHAVPAANPACDELVSLGLNVLYMDLRCISSLY